MGASNERIVVTGFVDDIRPYLQQAWAATALDVAPVAFLLWRADGDLAAAADAGIRWRLHVGQKADGGLKWTLDPLRT